MPFDRRTCVLMLLFQTLWQPDIEHSAASQQTQRGFHGEERTAARRLHPPIQQRSGQGKRGQINVARVI